MVRMEISEVRTQTSQMKAYVSSLKTAADKMLAAGNALNMDNSLSSEAINSIKDYLGLAYPALSRALIMYAEALEEANQSYQEGYVSNCGSASLDSAELEMQIAQAQLLVQGYQQQVSSLERTQQNQEADLAEMFSASFRSQMNYFSAGIERNQQKIAKLQEKLEKLLAFDALSNWYFYDAKTAGQLVSTALSGLGRNENGTIGTGSWNGNGFSGYRLAWIKQANVSWEKRTEKLDRAALEGCTIIKIVVPETGEFSYIVEKNGHRYDPFDQLSADIDTLVNLYGLGTLEMSPKEIAKRVNDYQKSGRDYFRGEKFPIWGVGGLSHVQDFVEKNQENGVWDALMALGFTFSAVKNAGRVNKVEPKKGTGRPYSLNREKSTGNFKFKKSPKNQLTQREWVEQNIRKSQEARESSNFNEYLKKEQEVLERIEKAGGATGTVWDDIKGTQPVIEGTSIPKSFEMTVNGEKFWVNPNGTKHMVEYSTRNLSHGRKLTEQQLLTSLQASTAEAVAKGYTYNVPIKVRNWELIFSPPRQTGQLPVIKHAQYIP